VFVETGHGAIQHHDIGLTVACEIHELRLPPGQGEVGFDSDKFDWRQPRLNELRAVIADWERAEVAFVEPGVGLLGENPGDALAVQVDPLIAGAIETDGQVLEAFRVQFENTVLDVCPAVFEFERR